MISLTDQSTLAMAIHFASREFSISKNLTTGFARHHGMHEQMKFSQQHNSTKSIDENRLLLSPMASSGTANDSTFISSESVASIHSPEQNVASFESLYEEDSVEMMPKTMPPFTFSGSHFETKLEGVCYTLFQDFKRTDNNFTATTNEIVFMNNEANLFFFAATPNDENQTSMAFVFNLQKKMPELVPLEKLEVAREQVKIHTEELAVFKTQMEEFMMEKQGCNTKHSGMNVDFMEKRGSQTEPAGMNIASSVNDDVKPIANRKSDRAKKTQQHSFSPDDLKWKWDKKSKKKVCRSICTDLQVDPPGNESTLSKLANNKNQN
jgi:hypothetical protein